MATKVIKFITSEARSKFLLENVKFATVTTEPSRFETGRKSVILFYEEEQESSVIQSVFHSGIFCGVDEVFSEINK